MPTDPPVPEQPTDQQRDRLARVAATERYERAAASNLTDVDPDQPHPFRSDGWVPGAYCVVCVRPAEDAVHTRPAPAEPVLAGPEPEPVTSTDAPEGARAPRAGDSGLTPDDYLDMGWEPKLVDGRPEWVRGTKHLARSRMEPDHAHQLVERGLLPAFDTELVGQTSIYDASLADLTNGDLTIEAWLSGAPVSGYPGAQTADLMRDAASLIEEFLFQRGRTAPGHVVAKDVAARLRGHADAFDHLADPANWHRPRGTWAARWLTLSDLPARWAEDFSLWLNDWAQRRRAG